jgi:hypothetical protein
VGHKRNERGASLVEFALLLPILVLILFGIIDFGSLYNNYQSVRQGARDGMRQAIVADPGAPPSPCTIQAGGNVPASGPAYDWICYTKHRIGLSDSDTRVKLLWKAPAVGATDQNPFPAGNPFMVCVQYKASSLSGVLGPFINGRVLNTQAETLIEQDNTDPGATFPAPSGGIYDVHEPAISSGGWPSSCTL